MNIDRVGETRMYDYSSLDRVREILTRANADDTAREEFESGIRKWGIGACYLTLTPEQYKPAEKPFEALEDLTIDQHKSWQWRWTG